MEREAPDHLIHYGRQTRFPVSRRMAYLRETSSVWTTLSMRRPFTLRDFALPYVVRFWAMYSVFDCRDIMLSMHYSVGGPVNEEIPFFLKFPLPVSVHCIMKNSAVLKYTQHAFRAGGEEDALWYTSWFNIASPWGNAGRRSESEDYEAQRFGKRNP